MPDEKKGEIYFAQVEGQPARLIRSTDARLARKHVLAGVFPPKIEVRRPTTEEAMDMALDGVAVEDATGEAEPESAAGNGTPAPAGDGATTPPAAQSDASATSSRPDLTDPVRTNPDEDDQGDMLSRDDI